MKEIRMFSGGYRELFPVKSNPQLNSRFYIARSSDGELLYVTECDVCKDAMMMMMEREVRFYRLEKEEYRAYLEKAKRTGRLDKAVKRGLTTYAEAESLAD